MAELQPPAPDYPEPVGRRMLPVQVVDVELPVPSSQADDPEITGKDEPAQ